MRSVLIVCLNCSNYGMQQQGPGRGQQRDGLQDRQERPQAAGQMRLTTGDALSYLREVKARFSEHKETYDTFLEIMKKFKASRYFPHLSLLQSCHWHFNSSINTRKVDAMSLSTQAQSVKVTLQHFSIHLRLNLSSETCCAIRP